MCKQMGGCIDDGWMDKGMNGWRMDRWTDQHGCSAHANTFCQFCFLQCLEVVCQQQVCLLHATQLSFLSPGRGRKQGQIIRRRTPARPVETRLWVATAHQESRKMENAKHFIKTRMLFPALPSGPESQYIKTSARWKICVSLRGN